MACFSAPAAVGILTTVLGKRVPSNWHIDWLNKMIFGGTLVLGAEHIIHGEIVPWPPFLTAMATPAGTAAMFSEILAVGIPMTTALVLAWLVMVLAYEKILVKRPAGALSLQPTFFHLMAVGAGIMLLVDSIFAIW